MTLSLLSRDRDGFYPVTQTTGERCLLFSLHKEESLVERGEKQRLHEEVLSDTVLGMQQTLTETSRGKSEGLLYGSWFEGPVHHGGEARQQGPDTPGCIVSAATRERGMSRWPAPGFLLTQTGTPFRGMSPPTVRLGLPTLYALI